MHGNMQGKAVKFITTVGPCYLELSKKTPILFEIAGDSRFEFEIANSK